MVFKGIAGLCLALVAASVVGQTPVEVPEWVEDNSAAPPAFSKDALIPIDMPAYVTLKVGIDPATLTVGTDGVVRYVVVMFNATGSVNAAYEGILCSKGEVKTYARAGTSGNWVVTKQPEWKALTDNSPSRHAYAIAKQGGCDGRTASKREAILDAFRRGRQVSD